MLVVKGVKAGYTKKGKKTWESSEINFQAESGEMLAFVGKSGCGKTTLLNILAGIARPETGLISFDKKECNPSNVKIGLIPQNYGLLPFQTVWQNGFFCAGKHANQERELERLLKKLGIWQVREHYPSQLSGGQCQRAALARALLMQPQLLLMDEPFSALDAATSKEAQEITLNLMQESNATGVLITHQIEEALFLADKIMVMQGKGEIVQEYQNQWKGCMETSNRAYRRKITELASKMKESEEE